MPIFDPFLCRKCYLEGSVPILSKALILKLLRYTLTFKRHTYPAANFHVFASSSKRPTKGFDGFVA